MNNNIACVQRFAAKNQSKCILHTFCIFGRSGRDLIPKHLSKTAKQATSKRDKSRLVYITFTSIMWRSAVTSWTTGSQHLSATAACVWKSKCLSHQNLGQTPFSVSAMLELCGSIISYDKYSAYHCLVLTVVGVLRSGVAIKQWEASVCDLFVLKHAEQIHNKICVFELILRKL